jgi:ABC-2 type transport system permease protein
MNDFSIIFQAELRRKLRSRSFIVATAIAALAIVGLSLAPAFVARAFNESSSRLIVAGDPQLVAAAVPLLVNDDFTVVAARPGVFAPPARSEMQRRKVAAEAVLRLSAHRMTMTIYARDIGNVEVRPIARALVPLNLSLATALSPAAAAHALDIPVVVRGLDDKFHDQDSAATAHGIAYLLVFLLYMSILLNSQSVMASVAEEKTSRIAELLVATTTPARLLSGKIAAAGVAGTLQLAIWIAAGAATGAGFVNTFSRSTPATRAALPHAGGIIDIPLTTIGAFVVFFILGFVQYATLYAAAASLINRTEDLGNVAGPLVIPVIGGFVVAQFAMQFPNAAGIAIASEIPLLSPFVMFTRMTITTVPAWQIALAIVINALAVWAVIVAGGRIYRVGLLLYGRLPSIPQVITALRA